MNSENGCFINKGDELSSISTASGCAERNTGSHASNKISSCQEPNGPPRSKMKKPDMPIYVPRGRRFATGTSLKFGEESKSLQAADVDDQDSETKCHLVASKEDSISDAKQFTVSPDTIDTKKNSEKKKTSKKASKISPECQRKKREKVNRKLVNNSITVTPSGVNSVAMEFEVLPKVDDSIALKSVLCTSELGEPPPPPPGLHDGTITNNLDVVEILVDHSSTMAKENISTTPFACSCADESITPANVSTVTVNVSQPFLPNGANSDIANGDSVSYCLNLATSSKNSAGSDGQIAVESSLEDRQKTDSVVVGDQSWDALFDDTGEALHAETMTQITDAVGAITVQKPQFDYLNYQPRDPEIGDEEFEHLLEIYDFPASLQTVDLVTAFKDFQDNGFEIKWVDDTHAIGIFSGRTAARSALTTFVHPLMKVRPIQQATRQTKLKAKKCTEFLQPYKPRPIMVASVARNLVAGALGLQSRVSKEKREEEKQKLKAARDQKRASKKQKEDMWEGRLETSAMDET